MDPSRPRWRNEDFAERREAERYVRTAKDLLAAGNPECWQVLVKAYTIDPGAPGTDVLFVAATALRAPQLGCSPTGDPDPDPYAVFGLDPAVPTARNLAVIESYHRRASELLNRCDPNDPCSPAFKKAAGLVDKAWASLSNPKLKASIDSRFEAATTAGETVATAPQPAPSPPLSPPPSPPPERRESERSLRTARTLLAAGEPDHCWKLVIKAITADQGVPGADGLLVAATALRAPQLQRLPSGAPDPYTVFGLDPAVPTARNLAVIQSYYHHASELLNHCHPNDPCCPAFKKAAGLVDNAWAFLSDPNHKASIDSRFEPAATAVAPVPTAPQPAPLQLAVTTQAGPDDMVRGKRKRKSPAQAVTTMGGRDNMGRGKRARKPVPRMNL